MKCRILTYSHYKGTNTFKILVGVSPAGLITFVSEAYGGRTSDKYITVDSGILDKLTPYSDKVMVDKGFHIENECLNLGLELIRPPFLHQSKQFSKQESMKTALIARARVLVERSIQRLKLYKILQKRLDWNHVGEINEIIQVCVSLANLSNPILADDKF